MLKKKYLLIAIGLLMIFSFLTLVGCSNSSKERKGKQNEQEEQKEEVVNLYTDRHYETDEELLKLFTEETGIKVNVVKGKSDELIERLAREGVDSQADLLVTADAGRLHRAKAQGLLKAATTDTLAANVPENLRDKDNQWWGLTVRARVIVYSKDRVNPSELSTYEDLTSAKWKGKVLVRPSENIYNQSLLASFIAINGEKKAKEWAAGLVKNMAREPQGSDRDQAKAVVAGEGDLAIMNTYYVGNMANSSDPEEVKVAEKVGVFFPNQGDKGTHINVSGIGLTKSAKNEENAVKLMEFLSSEKAQKQFAEANYEYPVHPNVEPAELLKSWGEFKAQDINLSALGDYNSKAVEIFNEVGWK